MLQANFEPKPEFTARMKKLLQDKQDYENFLKIIKEKPENSIRANTLKIASEKLRERLESKSWIIEQPFPEHEEIMLIKNNLKPGELGKSIEHVLGYYYIQDISSMMPAITLNPKENELVLDLCASPGSKTTQLSSLMKNSGTIIANDFDKKRAFILSININRCSCSNVIITRHDAVILCEKLAKLNFKFDKILLDLPCSGEGIIRSNPKILEEWNINTIKNLSKIQKKIAGSAIKLLKQDGELVYSTCTFSPEENEKVVSFLAESFNLEIEKISLPIKTRHGLESWEGEKFTQGIENCLRIYPQDNNTEGFFLAKMRKK